jgi:adenine deaminase
LSATLSIMPAEVLLRNARILDVFSGRFSRGDLAWAQGQILGFGGEAERVVDVDGAYVIPGFIDSHVHIESSKLSPKEFAKAVLPHGTTAVISLIPTKSRTSWEQKESDG